MAGPVQRLFGVVALHVQSAGGGSKGEIVLEALGPQAVERLRAAVGEQPAPAAAAEAPPVIERRFSAPRPPRRRADGGPLGVVLPVLAASTQLFGNVISSERDIEDASRLLPDTPGGWELALGGLLLAGLGALDDRGARLVRRLHRGARRRPPAHPARAAPALRRGRAGAAHPCACAWSRACCGARSGSPRCGSRSRATPRSRPPRARCTRCCDAREVAAFLAELLPELADEPGGLTAPPARAARRYVMPPAIAGLVVGGGACLLVPGRRAVAAAPRPRCSRSTAGWTFKAAGLATARGPAGDALAQLATHDASRSRPRGCRSTRPPRARFQRRAGLADLAVAVGKARPRLRVRHLEAPGRRRAVGSRLRRLSVDASS